MSFRTLSKFEPLLISHSMDIIVKLLGALVEWMISNWF